MLDGLGNRYQQRKDKAMIEPTVRRIIYNQDGSMHIAGVVGKTADRCANMLAIHNDQRANVARALFLHMLIEELRRQHTRDDCEPRTLMTPRQHCTFP